jgi:Phytanoyl-CoA dioxygenase (PhyH)
MPTDRAASSGFVVIMISSMTPLEANPEAPESDETPALNEIQQGVADALRRDGYAVVGFRDLFDDATWSELVADAAPFVRQTEDSLHDIGDRPAKKHDFIVRRYLNKEEGAAKARHSLDSPWLRIGASETMLDIVNTYRGHWTRLHYLDNWYTVPFSAADKRIASQRWHRDPEEEHIVKVFLYLSDIDDEAGPFEYIRSSATGGRYGDFWPWAEGDRHPPEDELNQTVPPEDRLTLTGPAGTMIFCDTGGFHRGGFARTKPRILATWSYVSPATGKGHRFEVDFRGREANLPGKVLAALA